MDRFTPNKQALALAVVVMMSYLVGLQGVAASGEPSELISRVEGESWTNAQTSSYDGTIVAFEANYDNEWKIWIYDRLSRSSSHVPAPGPHGANSPAVSPDGKIIAFSSYIEDGIWSGSEVFTYDRETNVTTRISKPHSPEGRPITDGGQPSMSFDGRFVAFIAFDNIMAGDTNNTFDVFVADTRTGEVDRVSSSSSGEQANGISLYTSISADGRYVAFHSQASNLVEGDTNGHEDLFVRDRQTGLTIRASVANDGSEGNGPTYSGSVCGSPSISANGRYVAFVSDASNLVDDDSNGSLDVFVRDLVNGETIRVSDGNAECPSMSPDGQFVAFSHLTTTQQGYAVWEIVLFNIETGESRVVPETEPFDSLNSARPSLASTGELFFTSERQLSSEDDDFDFDVYVRTIGGGEPPGDVDSDGDLLTAIREVQQGTSDSDADSDDDGLNDYVESQWWPQRAQVFCGAICEFPNPTGKDVYVEVDWMHTANFEIGGSRFRTHPHEHSMTAAMIALLKNRFNAHSIALHIDQSDLGGGNEIDHKDEFRYPDDWSRYYFNQNGDGFTPSRRGLFHYMILAHANEGESNPLVRLLQGCKGGQGYSEGDMLVLYRDCIGTGETEFNDVVNVFMQELGHNLFGTIEPSTDQCAPENTPNPICSITDSAHDRYEDFAMWPRINHATDYHQNRWVCVGAENSSCDIDDLGKGLGKTALVTSGHQELPILISILKDIGP